jgi:hypothetical protein
VALEDIALAHLDNNVFDVIRAASAVQLQLESSTRADPSGAEPTPTAAAPEPSAPGGPVPTEVAPEADAALPDLPPPEPRQEGAGPGGGEQVVNPESAHTDGTGTRLPARDWLLRSGHNV